MIVTERLDIVPATIEMTRAALAGGQALAMSLDAIVPATWPPEYLDPPSLEFSYGHHYKGPSGIVDSGVAGLILGAAFLLSGRNLWACVLTHGFIDTVAVIVAYFGWDG